MRIHLFTLLFEDCSRLCVELVETSGAIGLMVQLISVAQETLQGDNSENKTTPKWITPMLLFIDLYEKVVLAMKRRDAMDSVCSGTWKWFEVASGKWQEYPAANNKLINDAFLAGEQSVKFVSGRKKYTVQFGAMMQANDESGSKKPIMISLKRDEKPKKYGKDLLNIRTENKEETKDADTTVENDDEEMETTTTEEEAADKDQVKFECSGLSPGQSESLLRAAVGLIAVPVEPDALNAILRLCLRLTRSFTEASLFAELGGIKLLLNLTQASSFSGFSSLASLLVRHVLEDEQTLRHTMEKIIRSSVVNVSSPTSKELHYLLRSLAPAACREPETFSSVAKNILRVDLTLLSKRGGEPEEDPRLLIKTLPGKSSVPAPPLRDVSKTVIKDLLDFLTLAEPDEPLDGDGVDNSKHDDLLELQPTSMASIINSVARSGPSVIRQVSNELIVNDKKDESNAKDTKENKEAEEKKKKRHLLPKSAICKLLAEMVKSYAGCAKLITEHMFYAGMSELVKEDCSALAFILDELLTSTRDKECSQLVKMLVAALASSNHAPEAQTSLVTEVKNALTRYKQIHILE